MDPVKIGTPFTEFPGRTFNEIIRRLRRLEAALLPRARGGRGGGSTIIYGVRVNNPGIPAATGWGSDNWGFGTVCIYNADGSIQEEFRDVTNAKLTNFEVNSSVDIDTSFSPAIVVGGTCETMEPPAEET